MSSYNTWRPWGTLSWSLSLTSPKQWFFIGAIGPEERSLAAWQNLRDVGIINEYRLFRISAPTSRFSKTAEKRLQSRITEFNASGGSPSSIIDIQLLCPLHEILTKATQAINNHANIILDISSLPKRLFFPILRILARSNAVQNLILTYSIPDSYPEDDVLSEDCDSWSHLPGFPQQIASEELLVVGLGFMAESLQQELSSVIDHESIRILIPFPAPLSAVRRSWEAVFNIESARNTSKFSNQRLDAADISSAFNRICTLARSSEAPLAFAPFGPKPISAAMCLYAIKHSSAVYYAQPKAYNPDYSLGVRKIGTTPQVNAYWIKHNSSNLYAYNPE